MYQFIRPFLFSQDSEAIHDRLLELMHRYPGLASLYSNRVKTDFESKLGWSNPIGLAAGFDKNGVALNFLNKLGFGAIEVGTVTRKPQMGNDRKRILRLRKEKALINWMGFPSDGAHAVKERIMNYQGDAALGINIGKNKSTPNSKAVDDYLYLFKEFNELANYITINISSPNTPGLRELQTPEFLRELFSELIKIKDLGRLCVKFSPDLPTKNLVKMLNVVKEFKIGGVIATNTTSGHELDKGGLSGDPLYQKSFDFVSVLAEELNGSGIDIVACGGISKPEQILSLKELGVNHFQIYTSFVYQGPEVLRSLLNSVSSN